MHCLPIISSGAQRHTKFKLRGRYRISDQGRTQNFSSGGDTQFLLMGRYRVSDQGQIQNFRSEADTEFHLRVGYRISDL